MAKFLYSRAHHQPSDKHALLVIITTIIIVLFMGIYTYNYLIFSPRDRIIKQYTKGLREGRATLIEDIIAKEYDASTQVEKDINEYVGFRYITRSDYRANSTNGLIVDTTIYGIKNFKLVKKEISLIGTNDAWYLVMGVLKEEFKEN